jgi:hypothetical protein
VNPIFVQNACHGAILDAEQAESEVTAVYDVVTQPLGFLGTVRKSALRRGTEGQI